MHVDLSLIQAYNDSKKFDINSWVKFTSLYLLVQILYLLNSFIFVFFLQAPNFSLFIFLCNSSIFLIQKIILSHPCMSTTTSKIFFQVHCCHISTSIIKNTTFYLLAIIVSFCSIPLIEFQFSLLQSFITSCLLFNLFSCYSIIRR